MYMVFFKAERGQKWCECTDIEIKEKHIILHGVTADFGVWAFRLKKGIILGFDTLTDNGYSVAFEESNITGMYNKEAF